MNCKIMIGNCLNVLDTLEADSVNCVVTSPPYWGLRNYLDNPDQLGQESTPQAYVANLVSVFDKIWRVLRTDGTVWLNIGDSYAGAGKNGGTKSMETGRRAERMQYGRRDTRKEWKNHEKAVALREKIASDKHAATLKDKDLAMIPARVAIALQDYGWYIRSEIIWHKTSAMPESVKDRPTKSHEMIYLLTKSPRYWYDADAVKTKSNGAWENSQAQRVNHVQASGGALSGGMGNGVSVDDMANLRDVWSIAPANFKGSHFATFPSEIPRRCILAGCPKGGVVLDPFGGAGTTGLVADRLGRDSILIELNQEYAEMARQRIVNDNPMFADVEII